MVGNKQRWWRRRLLRRKLILKLLSVADYAQPAVIAMTVLMTYIQAHIVLCVAAVVHSAIWNAPLATSF